MSYLTYNKNRKIMIKTSIFEFRNNTFNILNSVFDNDECISVTTEKGNVVILSESKYNSLLETIYLNSQKNLVGKIKEGEKERISSMLAYNSDEDW